MTSQGCLYSEKNRILNLFLGQETSRSFAGLSFTRLHHIQSRFSQLYNFLSSNYSSPGILLFGDPRDLILNETPCCCIFTVHCLPKKKNGGASRAHFFSRFARWTRRAKEELLAAYVCPCGQAISG